MKAVENGTVVSPNLHRYSDELNAREVGTTYALAYIDTLGKRVRA
jgi:hypothetical protein